MPRRCASSPMSLSSEEPETMRLTDRAHLQGQCDAVLKVTPEGLRSSLYIAAEDSTFLRFNHGLVRQATQVCQAYATLTVSDATRSAHATVPLTGEAARDTQALLAMQDELTQTLPGLPEDPHLMLPETVVDTVREEDGDLPTAEAVIEAVERHAAGLDLVGLYAGGPQVCLHAYNRGQRKWHKVATFCFDWCLYRHADKAVKSLLAGTHWDEASFAARIEASRPQLAMLAQPPMMLAPGQYRAYFSPTAVAELLRTLSWGGFSHKEQAVGTSPLMPLVRGDIQVHPVAHLSADIGH